MSGQANGAVFLSYASQDAGAARRICDALRAGGIEVWFDQSELSGGAAWDIEIRRRIKECALFVPLISANTEQRLEGYFRLEWRLAEQRTYQMAQGKPFLVPVAIDETRENSAHVPDTFVEVQWTRLPGGEGAAAFARHISSLLVVADAQSAPHEVASASSPGDAGAAASSGSAARAGQVPAPVATRRLGAFLIVASTAAVVAAGLSWFLNRDTDARWLTDEAIPKIEAFLNSADWESAYSLAKQAEARLPNSPELAEVWPRLTWRVTIPSEPSGATVYRQAYNSPDGEWEKLGVTPLESIRFPYGLSRLRFELPGYRPLVRALGGAHLNWEKLEGGNPLLLDTLLVGPENFRLDTSDTLPEDMVRVPGWTFAVGGNALELRDFFLGRHEVTNAEYKRFVDAGGYQRASLWDPVIVDGKVVPWNKAMELFVDRTGRPGPSTWQASDHQEADSGLPVSGVSWYEAAAYARFVGRELPTAHHWQRALANAMFPWLLPLSNYGGKGPRAVAESRAMGYAGVYDMTGNVREWTATAIGQERVVLGGSWNDAYYVAGVTDSSASPLDRSASNGIRLAMTQDEPAIAAQVRASFPSRLTAAPADNRQPVSNEVYSAYARVFDYDRGPLNAALEDTHKTGVWTRERIRFDAAYGGERMVLHLFLPNGGSPPYQTVVYWPGWDTFWLDDVDEYFAKQLDFIVKSGRAVAFPVYKGIFQRKIGNATQRPAFNTAAYRDNTIDTVKDLRRAIDYLETRGEIDRNALAFFGYSWGGVNGPTAMAQESRLRVGVIDIGFLPPMPTTPEVDPLNALPRIKAPVLLLSSEFDPMIPIDNSRRYFALLGSPVADKRHVVAVGGHFIPRDILIRESLDWLDARLGVPRR